MKKLYFILLALGLTFSVFAQSNVKGKVVDTKGAPIAGAKVTINNLAPVFSGKDGSFKLDVKDIDVPFRSDVVKEGYHVEEIDYDEDNNLITIDLIEVSAKTPKGVTPPVAAAPAQPKQIPTNVTYKILTIDSLNIPLAHVKIVVDGKEYFSDDKGEIVVDKMPVLEQVTSPIMLLISSRKANNFLALVLKPKPNEKKGEEIQSQAVANAIYYDKTFHAIAEDIQRERKVLLQYSVKIQNEIIGITERLKKDTTISDAKRFELERKVSLLEEKLAESRMALIASDNKTGKLISQLKNMIVKKDSLQLATKAKLEQVTKEKDEANLRAIIYSSLSILFLMLSAALFFLYTKIQKQNEKIREQNYMITEQNVLINKHLDEVKQSIHAAKIIQSSILPPLDRIHQFLPQSWVYYKPRDIVGGDFYWFRVKQDESIYIAAIDCTGHGVPGALTSMMGFNILNQVFQQYEAPSPATILNEVNLRFIKATQNEETDILQSSIDGMDMSICKINVSTRVLDYAGAKLPLFLVRDGEMLSTKGSAFPIGTVRNGKLPTYEDTSLTLMPNDHLFIGSDGYTSQMGGPDGQEKYNNARFKDLLLELAKMPSEKQMDRVDQEFLNWKGNADQLDDILVIGFKFS